MKNFFSKISFTMMLAFAASAFVACDKNNDDDESQNQGSTSDIGVLINGVKWATRNVDSPGTFAAKPEDAGRFYQWNRRVAYPATGEVTNWDSSTPSGTEWEKANDPCPAGWRVPTSDEITRLLNSGSSWTFQNGVTGQVFGSGINTVFLPAAGYRDSRYGTLYYDGASGGYWLSTQFGSSYYGNYAYRLDIGSNGVFLQYSRELRYGLSVRCVQE